VKRQLGETQIEQFHCVFGTWQLAKLSSITFEMQNSRCGGLGCDYSCGV
jgi:hypothetical protein